MQPLLKKGQRVFLLYCMGQNDPLRYTVELPARKIKYS